MSITIDKKSPGIFTVNGKEVQVTAITWVPTETLTYEEKMAFGHYLNELVPIDRTT